MINRRMTGILALVFAALIFCQEAAEAQLRAACMAVRRIRKSDQDKEKEHEKKAKDAKTQDQAKAEEDAAGNEDAGETPVAKKQQR